jgi:voltage-gated potassium channel
MEQEARVRDGRAYEQFKTYAEIPLLFAALALIPILAAPFVFDLSAGVDDALSFAAWFIWALFVVEYMVLFMLAPNRWHMVRTHVFDLLIIVLPFLRPLRAARSARLLRLLTITGRIGVGFRAVSGRKGFRPFVLAVIVVVFVGGLLVYAFERGAENTNLGSLGDALWWAVVTATTVGYGDHTPLTVEGRAIAVVLMLVGIGLLSVVTANVAAYFVEAGEEDNDADVRERLERMEQMLAELLAEKSTVIVASPPGLRSGIESTTTVVDGSVGSAQ